MHFVSAMRNNCLQIIVFQSQVQVQIKFIATQKIHITAIFTNIKAHMVHGEGRNMDILQEVSACCHHYTYLNHLLKSFVRKENPV